MIGIANSRHLLGTFGSPLLSISRLPHAMLLTVSIAATALAPGHASTTFSASRIHPSTRVPLLSTPLDRVPLVGEDALLPAPLDEVQLDEVQQAGRFGLLLKTSADQLVSWTPLLRVDAIERGEMMKVRCVGRLGIKRFVEKPVVGKGMRLHCALCEPYIDVPLTAETRDALDVELLELERLHAEHRERSLIAARLRGLSSEDMVAAVEGETLASRALQRSDALGAHDRDLAWVLAAASAPGSAEQLLASFAAFDRGVATWKTRLAAMQCTDTAARVSLAKRAVRWTTQRLDAEISLRSAFVS